MMMAMIKIVMMMGIWVIIQSQHSVILVIWKWILNASKSENETTITFGGRNRVGGGAPRCIMEMDWRTKS